MVCNEVGDALKKLREARYQHLSPAFLAEAVRSLDTVFGNLCYPGVTSQEALPEPEAVSATG